MFLDGLAERTENDALFGELLFKSCADGYAIKHRIHRHAREPLPFFERDAKLLVGFEQLWIDFVKALGTIATLFWR